MWDFRVDPRPSIAAKGSANLGKMGVLLRNYREGMSSPRVDEGHQHFQEYPGESSSS